MSFQFPRKFKRGGILASTDPLAVDQAAIDMVYRAAAEIGLGKRAYRLVEVK